MLGVKHWQENLMGVLVILWRRFGGAVRPRENIPAPPVLRLVQEVCPWLPEEGSGSLTTWEDREKAKRHRTEQPSVFPFSLRVFGILYVIPWIHDCFFKVGSAEQIEFTGWDCPDLPDALDPTPEETDYEGEDTQPRDWECNVTPLPQTLLG